jgi:hypothetical protein
MLEAYGAEHHSSSWSTQERCEAGSNGTHFLHLPDQWTELSSVGNAVLHSFTAEVADRQHARSIWGRASFEQLVDSGKV